MNIAHKYAVAFLNVYKDRLNFEDIERIDQAAQFLQEHQRALFLLQVPVIKRDIKEEGLRYVCRRFALSDASIHLIKLLLDHKRAYLLADVFEAIVYRYQKRHNITRIVVKSSMPLHANYRQDIMQFIDQHVKGTKLYTYEIDPTLIAGVRLQSDTLLWEFSIDKKLRELAHAKNW